MIGQTGSIGGALTNRWSRTTTHTRSGIAGELR